MIVIKLAVDFQLGFLSEVVPVSGLYIHAVGIGFAAFKGIYMIFIILIPEPIGVYTRTVITFPKFALGKYIRAVFRNYSRKDRFVAGFEINGCSVNFYKINLLPRSFRSHGKNVIEPNGHTVIRHLYLIGIQSDLFIIDIELCIFIKTVALFKSQVSNIKGNAVDIGFAVLKAVNKLIVATVQVFIRVDTDTAVILILPFFICHIGIS